MTIEEYAQQTKGNELTLYYKDGDLKGAVTVGGQNNRDIFPTDQTINFELDTEIPEGLYVVTYQLNEYRKSNN